MVPSHRLREMRVRTKPSKCRFVFQDNWFVASLKADMRFRLCRRCLIAGPNKPTRCFCWCGFSCSKCVPCNLRDYQRHRQILPAPLISRCTRRGGDIKPNRLVRPIFCAVGTGKGCRDVPYDCFYRLFIVHNELSIMILWALEPQADFVECQNHIPYKPELLRWENVHKRLLLFL